MTPRLATLLLLSAVQVSLASAAPDFRALASAVIDGRVVAYSAAEKRIAVAVRYQVEGTGEGCDVEFLDQNGKRGGSLAVQDAQDDAAKATKRAIPKLATRLQSGGYVALDKTDWPADSPELMVPTVGVKLAWKRNQILGIPSGGKPILLKKLKVFAPHRATPVAVYAGSGVSVLVLAVKEDPGEAYLEGYNVVTEMHVVQIPEGMAGASAGGPKPDRRRRLLDAGK